VNPFKVSKKDFHEQKNLFDALDMRTLSQGTNRIVVAAPKTGLTSNLKSEIHLKQASSKPPTLNVTSAENRNELTKLSQSKVPDYVYKVNKVTIPAKKIDNAVKKLDLVQEIYSTLRDIGKNYGINIPEFQVDLIQDQKGNYRIAYLEPDIMPFLQNTQSQDLAYENMDTKSAKEILNSEKFALALTNVLNFSDKVYEELNYPPDIWGSQNIIGVGADNTTEKELYSSVGIENFHTDGNGAASIIGNTSLVKMNSTGHLFNQRKDFQLIINRVEKCLKNLLATGKLSETPDDKTLFFAAKTLTALKKLGFNSN
jgi:hypothetical protein